MREGLTSVGAAGLAPCLPAAGQVRNGYDGSVEAFRRKLEADLEYVEQRKRSIELKILARTIARFRDKLSR